jgi:hypothetical protein
MAETVGFFGRVTSFISDVIIVLSSTMKVFSVSDNSILISGALRGVDIYVTFKGPSYG